jgi:hypothetical protein
MEQEGCTVLPGFFFSVAYIMSERKSIVCQSWRKLTFYIEQKYTVMSVSRMTVQSLLFFVN